MFDAVYVFAQALQNVNISSPLRLFNISCESNKGWAFGSTLYNYLNMVSLLKECSKFFHASSKQVNKYWNVFGI